ncbi:putative uncharacterized protein DDB_G0294196 [Lucilia cuprina]|uniref:putative uncharacterized protein DDB_G0294196 n=1 Tax=Lucilia cuprina TaxID=7375 RepID=UPI001F05D646|nr:putative uncharacterized protein DDB_G0294196 [Lucilia cuprina]
MLIKLILLAILFIAKSSAEAPYSYNNQAAPYAPSGYRPNIPFDLPGEYYPSYDVDDSVQQLPNQGFTFEITKQRVDFAGQEVSRVPITEPEKQYLPAEEIVFINNQVGAGNNMRQLFNHRHNHNHGRRRNNRPGQRPTEAPQYPQTPGNKPPQPQPQPNLPTLPPANIPLPNLPNPSTDERFESQQRPALEYGAPPNYNIDPRNAGQQQQQQQPALEYGAPALEYGAPANSQSQKEEELEKQYALDALNVAVQNYNRLQENNNDRIAQGQYFVVNPDHSIQKVKFTTKKSEDETKQNDFTAELKYTKVGEINDPLYKYTAEGQLVRIVKK